MSLELWGKDRLGAFWSADKNDECFPRLRCMSDDLPDTHFNERLQRGHSAKMLKNTKVLIVWGGAHLSVDEHIGAIFNSKSCLSPQWQCGFFLSMGRD